MLKNHSSVLALLKIVAASQRKSPRKKSCHDLLTIKKHRLELESACAALHYANRLFVFASDFPFKNLCKLVKQAETIRNYQKQVLVVIKHCLGNSQINSQKREQTQKLTSITVARADIN